MRILKTIFYILIVLCGTICLFTLFILVLEGGFGNFPEGMVFLGGAGIIIFFSAISLQNINTSEQRKKEKESNWLGFCVSKSQLTIEEFAKNFKISKRKARKYLHQQVYEDIATIETNTSGQLVYHFKDLGMSDVESLIYIREKLSAVNIVSLIWENILRFTGSVFLLVFSLFLGVMVFQTMIGKGSWGDSILLFFVIAVFGLVIGWFMLNTNKQIRIRRRFKITASGALDVCIQKAKITSIELAIATPLNHLEAKKVLQFFQEREICQVNASEEGILHYDFSRTLLSDEEKNNAVRLIEQLFLSEKLKSTPVSLNRFSLFLKFLPKNLTTLVMSVGALFLLFMGLVVSLYSMASIFHFLHDGNAIGVNQVERVFVLVLFGLIPLALGYWLLSKSVIRFRNYEKENFQGKVLKFCFEKVKVTASDISTAFFISLDEAEYLLRDMQMKGWAELKISEKSDTVYDFSGFVGIKKTG